MRRATGGFPAAQRGVSFVEVLVSMTIGMIVLGGVMQALVTNQRNSAWSDDIAFIQENGRYALEMLARDTRWAGDWGCAVNVSATTTFANSVNKTGGEDWLSLEGLRGYEGSDEDNFPASLVAAGLWSADADNYVGSSTYKPDAIILKGADADHDLTVVSHNAPSANFKVSRLHNMVPGDFAMVISEDCTDVALMQMTGPNSNENVTFVHSDNSGNLKPGNCTKMIRWGGGSFDCTDIGQGANNGIDEGEAKPYGPGSRLMGYAAVGYHIGVSAADPTQPALYRVQFSSLDDAGVTLRSDEVAMGVEDMQILYGVDGDGDALADAYVRADEIGGASDPVDWDEVVSVRYMLLLRGYGQTREGKSAVDMVGYPFAGADSDYEGHEFNDGYIRQQVSKTVRLRNRNVGAG